ncbi:MAG: hypothetical protein QM800_12755 [Paludibacter sp.]
MAKKTNISFFLPVGLLAVGAFLFKKKKEAVSGIGVIGKNKNLGILTFREKINSSGEPIKIGNSIIINAKKLIGNSTKSLYIRTGFKNGKLFLSQRGNGGGGAGDICSLHENVDINVNGNLFDRIYQFAEKCNAII